MLLKPFVAVIAAFLSCSILVQAIGMPASCLPSSNTEQPEVADSLPSGRAVLQAIIGSLYVGHVVDVRNLLLDSACMGSLSDTEGLSLHFIYGNAQLVQDAQNGLRQALRLAADTAPGRKIVISSNPGNSRLETQLAWGRMKTITGFLVDNAWSADSIIQNYGQTVLPGSVQLRLSAAGEDGPAALPPPAPRIWEEE